MQFKNKFYLFNIAVYLLGPINCFVSAPRSVAASVSTSDTCNGHISIFIYIIILLPFHTNTKTYNHKNNSIKNKTVSGKLREYIRLKYNGLIALPYNEQG